MNLQPLDPPAARPSEPADAPIARVRAYPDGPFLIRGNFILETVEGEEIEVHRSVTALCRCGRSAQAPICDGSHRSRRRPAQHTSRG